MIVEGPELAAEGNVIFRRQVLITEQQHVVIEPRRPNVRDGSAIKRRVQIEPGNFGANGVRKGKNVNGHNQMKRNLPAPVNPGLGHCCEDEFLNTTVMDGGSLSLDRLIAEPEDHW